ncbi:hypothetical protein [Nonomuraea sp. NPDC046570]|uniref:hypothetical protein n=1 Tax=Nonomuraea sp. NPDC046570 TaxID=3155255 RepID=UPI0034078CBD
MTRRLWRRALSTCAGITIFSLPGTAMAHADPARPPSAEGWQRTASPDLNADSSLTDVYALSAGDVWAVGQQEIWDVWENRGAITHWNGSTWTQVPLRDATGAGHLRGVTATSPTDVWAIGDGHDGLPYLARGDRGGFDRVRVSGMRVGDWLGGIDARPGRVVAVGSRDGHGLIVTGQGSWSAVKTEQKGTLYSVSGPFAVGDTGKAPLIMRHTEGAWKAMPLPDVPGGYLRDVHAEGAKRALAVGGVFRGAGKIEPLALSWNGKKWTKVKLPSTKARLYGVAGDGKGRFWVTGYDPDRPAQAFLLRAEKDRWQIIRGGPAKGKAAVRLQSVAYLPGKGTIWAVGHALDAADRYTDVVETFSPKGSNPS